MKRAFLLCCLLSFMVFNAKAVRLKDLVDIKGERDNQLIGYGLVVGLNGTGDGKLDATAKSLAQMFRQLGIESSDKVDSKNVAAVIVTAILPPFARAGTRLDVIVNSVGDAKSLMGGTLLMTPLKAADQNIYAVAQGPLIVGGLSAEGSTKNHPTVGRVPGGAIIEREVRMEFDRMRSLRLSLRNPDFTTSARIAKTINIELAGKYANPKDSRTVDLAVPFQFENRVVDLMAQIEALEVTADTDARVVINEKTGTVVMGENVKIESCSVAHGNLTITVSLEDETTKETDKDGKTTEKSSKKKTAKVEEEKAALMELPKATRIKDVVRALNALGVKSRDLVDILQAMKAAGSLHAQLEIL